MDEVRGFGSGILRRGEGVDACMAAVSTIMGREAL